MGPSERPRRYDRAEAIIADRVDGLPSDAPVDDRLEAVVDGLWEALGDAPYSWCGFYRRDPAEEGLVLGPRRDRAACSPIGWHGCCGRSFRENRTLLVRDVRELGEAYVACDPRDRSEVVIPVRDGEGRPRAVLDVDSFEVGAFDEVDVRRLEGIVERFVPPEVAEGVGPPGNDEEP